MTRHRAPVLTALLLFPLGSSAHAAGSSCDTAAAAVQFASIEASDALDPIAALMPSQSTQMKLLLVLEATNDLAESSAAITSAERILAALPPAPAECPPQPVLDRAAEALESAKSTIAEVASGLTVLTGPLSRAEFLQIQAQSIADVQAVILLLDAAELQLLGLGPSCLGDLDGNGAVDGADVGLLLASWGIDDPVADLDGNGVVDGGDVGLLLAAWGAC